VSIPPTSAPATPAELRERGKADFSRALSRALTRHDVSQTDLSLEIGVDESLVQRWCDARRPDAMTPADIVLAGKRWPALARELLDALAEPLGLFIGDENAPSESDASLSSVAGALAAVIAVASANEADGTITAEEARHEREVWAHVYEIGAAREQQVLKPAINHGHIRVAGRSA
jgi:hypothetical protein